MGIKNIKLLKKLYLLSIVLSAILICDTYLYRNIIKDKVATNTFKKNCIKYSKSGSGKTTPIYMLNTAIGYKMETYGFIDLYKSDSNIIIYKSFIFNNYAKITKQNDKDNTDYNTSYLIHILGPNGVFFIILGPFLICGIFIVYLRSFTSRFVLPLLIISIILLIITSFNYHL